MLSDKDRNYFNLLLDDDIPGLFSLVSLFSKEWCNQIIHHADNHNQWTTARHENYPTHDMLLKDVDEELYKEYCDYQREFIVPYFAEKYHTSIDEDDKFDFEVFIAKYSPDKQSHLGLHHDASLVTTIVTLNDSFEGGGTFFYDQKSLLKPPIGTLSIHPGALTHYHGARPVTKGTRYVLVTFINMVDDCND